jgi:hypothetical protein
MSQDQKEETRVEIIPSLRTGQESDDVIEHCLNLIPAIPSIRRSKLRRVRKQARPILQGHGVLRAMDTSPLPYNFCHIAASRRRIAT